MYPGFFKAFYKLYWLEGNLEFQELKPTETASCPEHAFSLYMSSIHSSAYYLVKFIMFF